MTHRILWWFGQLRQRLWVRPLVFTVAAVGAVAVAAAADDVWSDVAVPRLAPETIEDLLAIIAASMLSVATLAVASMVAAYASASSSGTPRAFTLVVADDVTQTALSGFIGAYIFSLVALTAVKTRTYGPVGLAVTFGFTVVIFATVILLFLRWVDRIARLGRLGSTIDRVETAARAAIDERRRRPRLGGTPVAAPWAESTAIPGDRVGYVQSIDVAAVQACASDAGLHVRIDAVPGTFIAPGRALAWIDRAAVDPGIRDRIVAAFIVGADRTYEADPRFGLVVLGEIAARALSPGVNDPGTAIQIVGTLVRLFVRWVEPCEGADTVEFNRVAVPALEADDLFDDAFTAIARDGAAIVEVAVRLQKALGSLALVGGEPFRRAARRHAALALARAESALTLAADLAEVRAVASGSGGSGA
ncbi:MAG: DUF2254 domain-containing protein [Vicinamibacterales bacterium]